MRLLRRAERWLFAPGSPNHVWFLRTGLAALMAVRLAMGDYRELASQPEALFRPPFFWRLLDHMPSSGAIGTVQVVGLVLAVLAVASWKPRWTFAAAWLCFVFLEGLLVSRAKIMHNQVLPVLAAVPVLVAPAAVRWDDRRPRAATGWPVRAALVVVAGAYTFCGVAKLLSSGLGWALTDNLRWILYAGARSSKPPTHELARFVADHDLLTHAVALGALALEVTFFLVLVRAGLRLPYAVGAVLLHTGIWLTLGLDYWSWVVTVLLVLPPWDRWLARLQTRVASRSTRPSSSRAHAT